MGNIFHPEKLQGCHPRILTLVQAWGDLPFDIQVQQGVRTTAQQAALYAQGRTAPGPVVTNAPTASSSPHGERVFGVVIYGCAVDACPVIGGKLLWTDQGKFEQMDAVAQQLGGFVWGHTFKSLDDDDHWELDDWRNYPPVTTDPPI